MQNISHVFYRRSAFSTLGNLVFFIVCGGGAARQLVLLLAALPLRGPRPLGLARGALRALGCSGSPGGPGSLRLLLAARLVG